MTVEIHPTAVNVSHWWQCKSHMWYSTAQRPGPQAGVQGLLQGFSQQAVCLLGDTKRYYAGSKPSKIHSHNPRCYHLPIRYTNSYTDYNLQYGKEIMSLDI